MNVIMIQEERYNRMLDSYDKAMEELRTIKAQLKAISGSADDVAHELEVYDMMDKQECDRDTAELLLLDREENVAISQLEEEGAADED